MAIMTSQPQIAKAGETSHWSVEDIVSAYGLREIGREELKSAIYLRIFRVDRAIKPPILAVKNYEAGTRFILPTDNKGCSSIEAKLQFSSTLSLDNLSYQDANVFAAATHPMWVELESRATALYLIGSEIKTGRDADVPVKELILLPAGGDLRFTISGIKNIPELEVLSDKTTELVYSPDVVILRSGITHYDISAVGINTKGAARLASQGSMTVNSRSLLNSASLYASSAEKTLEKQ